MFTPSPAELKEAALPELETIINQLLDDLEAIVLNPHVQKRPYYREVTANAELKIIHQKHLPENDILATLRIIPRGDPWRELESPKLLLWSTQPGGYESSPYFNMDQLELAYRKLIRSLKRSVHFACLSCKREVLYETDGDCDVISCRRTTRIAWDFDGEVRLTFQVRFGHGYLVDKISTTDIIKKRVKEVFKRDENSLRM